VRDTWDRRIQRAEALAREETSARALLSFYGRLLHSQRAVYDAFDSRPPTGALTRDLAALRPAAFTLIRLVADVGSDQLADEARTLLAGGDRTLDQLLLTYWHAPISHQFFPKAILQPYGQRLADDRVAPEDRQRARADNRCPFCGGMPQLATLDAPAVATAERTGRQLLCANCLGHWSFRRVVCARCGVEDERLLVYFQSPAFDHVRVDACENCHHYLKTVDFGRLGLAVPLVDEVASAPLDVWARERGYQKIELNLLGL
jgi:formate dehydrogenase maturation protein FdhE